jgi:hypothetical protein
MRAERKAGELLARMEKATPSGSNQHVSREPTHPRLQDYGITRDQSSEWQRLAKMPQAEFERRLVDPPMTRGQSSRAGPDFWPTPPCLIAALIRYVLPVLPDAAIWEPAAGAGGLVRALRSTGRKVIATDFYPQDGSAPHDFIADPPLAETAAAIVITNPPNNQWDDFLDRGLALQASGALKGLVLLLRHDYLQAGGRVDVLNQAIQEVHCNWRPIWIPDTEGNPRHSFHWLSWHEGLRRPPLYLTEGEAQ